MNMRQGIDGALRHIERLQSPATGVTNHVCQWRGKTFACSISTERRGERLIAGGFEAEVQLTILLRRSELDPTTDASLTSVTADDTELTADDDSPEPRANWNIKLVTRNRTYRIVSVRLNSCESHFSIDCVDAYTP